MSRRDFGKVIFQGEDRGKPRIELRCRYPSDTWIFHNSGREELLKKLALVIPLQYDIT